MAQKNGGYYDPNAKPGDYRVILGACCLTGEQGKVISVLTHVIDFDLPDGSKDACQVWCQYGAEGLSQMHRALAESPFPAQMPSAADIRANLAYYWHAFYPDGQSVRQWSPGVDGEPPIEKHFGDLDPHRVARLFLLPKDAGSDRPAYCWDREQGLLRAERVGAEYEALVDSEGRPLPWPKVPCHLEYCFRPQITVIYDPAHTETFPVHVRHELGWRVDTLHGDAYETLFLLAIEDDDGGWQVLKRAPEESVHFSALPWDVAEAQMASRVIEGDVKIISTYG